VDNSALFEVRIDIPELGLIQVTAVLFEAYSHEVAPAYIDWLDHYARTLKRYPLAHVRIEAHTDSIGSESSNQVLSELRAMEVKNQLVQRGVSESRIRSIGLGERYPVASNEGPEGRRQNRRVQILNYFPVERR
jgi:outer membrane protein OmpA-like peptidoglycan-associated protein